MRLYFKLTCSIALFRCYLLGSGMRALISWPGSGHSRPSVAAKRATLSVPVRAKQTLAVPAAQADPAQPSAVPLPLAAWLISAAAAVAVVVAGRPLYTFNLCFVIYINRVGQQQRQERPLFSPAAPLQPVSLSALGCVFAFSTFSICCVRHGHGQT